MLTKENASRIAEELCQRWGLVLAYKTGTPASVVGAGFDVARAFGASVPSGDDFVKRTATVLPLLPFAGLPSGLLLMPVDDGTARPAVRLGMIAHEAKHCHQYRTPAPGYSAWAWGVQYAQHSEFRAQQEAGGYVVQLALSLYLSELGSPAASAAALVASVVHPIVNGYALDEQDKMLAVRLLEQDAHSLRLGVIRCPVTAYVVRRIAELQPDALTALGAQAASLLGSEAP